jgi:organic hydroperoxide reductase OsmC/OhrA
MASTRILQRLHRRASTLTRSTPILSRRLINTATAPILASAHVKATGARNGHIVGDGLKVDLTMPKSIGGAGEKGKTNPEELFAAAYAACFQGAMNACAGSMGIKMPEKLEDSVVEARSYLVGDLYVHLVVILDIGW